MSHVPRLPKRSSGISPLPGFPPLLDGHGRAAPPCRQASNGRDLIDGTLLLASIVLSGAIFAAAIWALIWLFALIEAALI